MRWMNGYCSAAVLLLVGGSLVLCGCDEGTRQDLRRISISAGNSERHFEDAASALEEAADGIPTRGDQVSDTFTADLQVRMESAAHNAFEDLFDMGAAGAERVPGPQRAALKAFFGSNTPRQSSIGLVTPRYLILNEHGETQPPVIQIRNVPPGVPLDVIVDGKVFDSPTTTGTSAILPTKGMHLRHGSEIVIQFNSHRESVVVVAANPADVDIQQSAHVWTASVPAGVRLHWHARILRHYINSDVPVAFGIRGADDIQLAALHTHERRSTTGATNEEDGSFTGPGNLTIDAILPRAGVDPVAVVGLARNGETRTAKMTIGHDDRTAAPIEVDFHWEAQ